MPVLRNISYLYTCSEASQGRIDCFAKCAIAWSGDRLSYVGPQSTLPECYDDGVYFDGEGCIALPGLIDCHTHLVFKEFRSEEFERKIMGTPYVEIAKQGGGIMSTVRSTRVASAEELKLLAFQRLREMLALGVTSIEAKSGYGLDLESEIKILTLHRQLSAEQPIEITSTCLGAHVVPTGANRKEYISFLTETLMPRVRDDRLAEFFDIFVEEGAFSPDEARVIAQAAIAHGLRLKLHVDQLSDCNGALLAAELGAVSADHLERTGHDGAKALARAAVVATLLPIASLYTFQKPALGRALIDEGVSVAVATDFNPGTAPAAHLPLALLLACTLNRLTPQEALAGVTWNAARAINRLSDVGALTSGRIADICLVEARNLNEWIYNFRGAPAHKVWKRGKLVFPLPATARASQGSV